jgi:hypothetical protein
LENVPQPAGDEAEQKSGEGEHNQDFENFLACGTHEHFSEAAELDEKHR